MKIRATGRKLAARLRLARARARGKTVVRFLHIRKTGGTAVRHALGFWHESESHFFTFQNHHYHLDDVEPWARAAFVYRDPIARYVSGFNDRRREGKPRFYSPWRPEEKEAFARFDTPEALALGLGAPEAGTRAEAEAAMGAIRHLKYRYDYWFTRPEHVADQAHRIAFVGCQESLAEDFARLVARAHLTGVALPVDEVRAHRGPRPDPLSPQARGILREWYDEDYRFVAAFEEIRARHAAAEAPAGAARA